MIHATRSRIVIFLLLPMLLLAQGMCVCLHGHASFTRVASQQHNTLLHLESTLSGLSDHGEAPGNVDVPFSTLIKLCSAALAFAIVPMLVFFLLALPQRDHRFPPGHSRPFYFSVLHYLSPPLRAPPR
jgi:hypothetical protein